jgi:hypothetical protein
MDGHQAPQPPRKEGESMKHMDSIRFLVALLTLEAGTAAQPAPGQKPDFSRVPGIVVDHSPAASGIYIGSPSLAVLPDGSYLASHDEFGPKSREHELATSHVFRSQDSGLTWKKISTIEGAFWSSLFVHRGAVYLMGPDKHHGDVLIRRSMDRGLTWTTPVDGLTGRLTSDGQYHCAPMPVIEQGGRLWRPMERRDPPVAWGVNYRAGIFSASVDADLLNAANWRISTFLPSDTKWLHGTFGAWLEGNAVFTREGRGFNILRVEVPQCPEKAAIVGVSVDGTTLSFDPDTGFVDFPGGAKKFAIRHDPPSDRYWTLATVVPERHQNSSRPGGIRNTLALASSPDLRNWTVRCILLYHPDVANHGFQYVDWQIEGDDILALCRTAYEDGLGGAHNNHDANFLTFHRWKEFRGLTLRDSVPMPEPISSTPDHRKTRSRF